MGQNAERPDSAAAAAAVDRFYMGVLANARLAAFFAHVSLETLEQHQREFLAVVLGGPRAYTGPSPREAHAGRGITDADFDRIVHHLLEACFDLGVAEPVVARVGRVIEPLRAEIVETAPR